MWCPLAPFHHDFATFRASYMRDAEKILAKEREGHVVRTRNVRDPTWAECDVLFIGDAPGGDEDRLGTPFVGRAGKLLRDTVAEFLPIDPSRVAYTELVRCRTVRNKKPGKTEIRACSPELIREIKERKPKLLVVLSNEPMEFLTGQTGITLMSGRFMQTIRSDIPVLPVLGCLHPSYVLFMDHELERFAEAIGLAHQFLSGTLETKDGEGEYFVLDNLAEIQALFKRFKEEKRTVSFDTETGALTPFQSKFPRLLCLSFSNGDNKGYTIPFDHAESPWSEHGPKLRERARLKKIIADFVTDPLLDRTGQNEKFDRQHIKSALGVDLPVTQRDTMMIHLVINEKRGTHGLDILAYEYTGMGGYDKELNDYKKAHRDADPEEGGSYANIPGHILFRYAAMDADVTWRVDAAIRNQPEFKNNPKFVALATKFFPVLSETLADMEYAGAQVDPAVVARLDAKLTKEMAESMKLIAALPMVKKFEQDQRALGKTGKRKADPFTFNPGSGQQLGKILFDYYKLRPVEMTEMGYEKMLARYRKAEAEAKAKGTPKKKYAELVNAAIEKKEWDLFSTKADVLHEYERVKNDLAPLVLKYRESETLHGTFVVPLLTMLDPIDKIHGSFWIHGTVTGRLSSSNPNLQNLPNKGGGTIKQCYVSRFGTEGRIVNVDFSQIELRVAAAWFNEPLMKRVYANKEDLHLLTASVIAGLSMAEFKKLPKDDGTPFCQKAWRTRAKRVNFGVLYGGGPPALQSTLKKDGVFVTLDECAEFIDKFFKAYPNLRAGMDKLEASVRKLGYLESFTGRHRRVPEVMSEDREISARAIRQCINFPIQSGAGDMTLMALVLINRVLKAEKFRSVVIATVHDSIVFDCPLDEVLVVSKLAKEIMENIQFLSDEVLPGIDWSWLDVPIVAECDVGHSWGTLSEYDPFVVELNEQNDAPFFGPNEKGKIVQLRQPSTWAELNESMDRLLLSKAV
jgi:uracil-DNA glycosylase family 4